MQNNLLKTSAILSFALLLGRFSGLFREWLLSFKLGLSQDTDWGILLFSFPDFITNLLLAGGFSAAFIPSLKQLSFQDAQDFFGRILVWVGLFAVAICGIFVLFPKIWFLIFAPGFITISNNIEIPLLITFLSLPLAMMSCVLNSYLNANNKFFVTGLGTLWFNLGIIVALILSTDPHNLLLILSLGIIAGTSLRFLAQWFCIPVKPKFNLKIFQKTINQTFFKNFILASLCSAITIALPFFIRTLYSFLGAGQVSAFNYANKIIEIILSLFITNVGIVLYPLLCSPETTEKAKLQSIALQKTLLLSSFFLFWGLLLGKTTLSCIYQHGACSSKDIDNIFQNFSWLLFALPFTAMNTIFSSQLYANNKIKKVYVANVIAVIVCCIIGGFAIKKSNGILLSIAFVSFHATCSVFLMYYGDPIKVLTKPFISKLCFNFLIFLICCFISCPFASIIKFLIAGFLFFYSYKFSDEKNF